MSCITQIIQLGSVNTLYNADDNLSGNRVVTFNGHNLTFSGGGNDMTFNGGGTLIVNGTLLNTFGTGISSIINNSGGERTALDIATSFAGIEYRESNFNAATLYVQFGSVAGRSQVHLWTANVDNAVAINGQFLQLTNAASGEVEYADLPSPYEQIFDATTDWGTASGGFYEITIAQATHGKLPIGSVQIWNGTTDFNLETTLIDRVRQNASGDVLFRVTDTPDNRFAGKVVIS